MSKITLQVDDYLQVIKEPMDLSTMMTRINSHHYHSCAHYLLDVDLITNNCLEYNPDRDQFDKLLRNRACELRDTAYALVYKDLDPDFEKLCIEIHETREKRGNDNALFAPSFMKVLPKHMLAPKLGKQQATEAKSGACKVPKEVAHTSPGKPSSSIPVPDPRGERFSRRVRGIHDANVDFAVDTVAIEYRAKYKKVKDKKEDQSSMDNALQEKTVDNSENSKAEHESDIADSVPSIISDIISAVDETSNEGPSKSDSDKENNSQIVYSASGGKNEITSLNENISEKLINGIELPETVKTFSTSTEVAADDVTSLPISEAMDTDNIVKASCDSSKVEPQSNETVTVTSDAVNDEKGPVEMEIAKDEVLEMTASEIDDEKAPVKRTLQFQERKDEIPSSDADEESNKGIGNIYLPFSFFLW